MNAQEAKKLENKGLKTLNQYIEKDDIVIAAISGGPDSIFLLYLLEKFQKTHDLQIVAAHLNHAVRTKECDKDEKFIIEVVQNFNNKKITVQTKKVNTKKLSKTQKKGLEEIGRKERYKFFLSLAKKYKATHIITAHHADDNLETIIMNLTRGSGIQGLCGMQIIEKFKNYELFRPLLNLCKAEIISYLKFKKIPYCIDYTNKDTKYTRNNLRHNIIPELKKINPNLAKTVAKNSQNLREINGFLKEKAEQWLKKNSTKNTPSPYGERNKKTLKKHKIFLKPPTLPLPSFQKLHTALQRQILRQIHEKITGSTKNLETIHIDEALTLIHKNIGNKKKKMGALIINIKSNQIKFKRVT